MLSTGLVFGSLGMLLLVILELMVLFLSGKLLISLN